MTPAKFDKLATSLFGEVLEPKGFSSEKSRHCTFYRQVSDEIYHIVLPDKGRDGSWYDVKVFPASPAIDPMFEKEFPDYLGFPSAPHAYLHSITGVGPDQEQFHCRTDDGMKRNFDKKVQPALVDKAVPFLDRIRTLQDMIPVVKSKLYLGLVLARCGQSESAYPLLKDERDRLSRLDSSDETVIAFLNLLNAFLETDS